MYTANIVDTVIFRSLGKHPSPHLETLKRAVEQANTEIWVPNPIYDELADHGVAGSPTNPYLDHGIKEGWIHVDSPLADGRDTGGESTDDPVTKAWHETNDFLNRNSKYPTTNNWRDASLVALAVHLFKENERIRVITHTADEKLAKACAIIPPEFGYYEVASRYYHPPQTAKNEFPTVDSLTWDEQ